MTRHVRVRSFAKINLDLRVLGRRPDGYHELRTVFQTVSLADTIEIRFTPSRKTTLSIAGNVEIPGNLILRAAEAVLDAMRRTGRIEFKLTKRIPMGGGLGGGSSNAAAVLLALPVLAGGSLGLEQRLRISEELGSDVSFFLLGGTAVGIGRGTELFPLPDRGTEHGVIVSPGIHVSTPEAYKALNRQSLTSGFNTSDTYGFQCFAWGRVVPKQSADAPGANDFESVVFGQYPQLRSIQNRLRRLGARTARMSGSGSALFGLFESAEAAREAREKIEKQVPEGSAFLIRTVMRSAYRRIWRRWLSEHLVSGDSGEWPPQSRYAR